MTHEELEDRSPGPKPKDHPLSFAVRAVVPLGPVLMLLFTSDPSGLQPWMGFLIGFVIFGYGRGFLIQRHEHNWPQTVTLYESRLEIDRGASCRNMALWEVTSISLVTDMTGDTYSIEVRGRDSPVRLSRKIDGVDELMTEMQGLLERGRLEHARRLALAEGSS